MPCLQIHSNQHHTWTCFLNPYLHYCLTTKNTQVHTATISIFPPFFPWSEIITFFINSSSIYLYYSLSHTPYMAACALFSGGGNITEDGNVNGSGSANSTPLTSASNSSNMSNEEQQQLHAGGIMPQPYCERKMMRKRMASEMEVNVHATPPHNSSSTTSDYPRFPRRSNTNTNMLEKGSPTTTSSTTTLAPKWSRLYPNQINIKM